MIFSAQNDFDHADLPAIGVLLANLGTPQAPTKEALRPYLKQFLSDPRVIELPRWKWWLILNLFVLNTRPAKSAEAYEQVWTEEGSPLLVYSQRQTEGVARVLGQAIDQPIHFALGMSYGEPSIANAARELRAKGCRRILFLPLYPQYSASTTASAFDALVKELTTWRWVPELRTVSTYHDRPDYIEALAASIRERWQEREPDKLLFSFHGVPLRYFKAGDPYHCFCQKTGRLVAETLGLEDGRWQVTFQSLFGREEWLKPYTDATIKSLPGQGVRSLDVICPGFSSDCLETIEEIDQENRGYWNEAGGADELYRYIPALNDRPDHIECLAGLVRENLSGWLAESWDEPEARASAEASKQRALALANEPQDQA